MNDDRVFFSPGELVKVRGIDSPRMVVHKVDKLVKTTSDHGNERILLGITCFWFTLDHQYQTARFNTKDLEKC